MTLSINKKMHLSKLAVPMFLFAVFFHTPSVYASELPKMWNYKGLNKHNSHPQRAPISSQTKHFPKKRPLQIAKAKAPRPRIENVNNVLAPSPHYIGFALGYFDVFDDKKAIEIRAEYASGAPLWGPFKPLFVAEITDETSFYGAAGLYVDYLPHKNIYIKPSITMGVYEEGRNGKDLGDGVIFRSQLEMGWQSASQHRFGLALSHVSNSGQDKDNKGSETISLYVHMPIDNPFSSKNGATKILGK